MRFLDISMMGFQSAWDLVMQHRGFSEEEKQKIRSYGRKLQPFREDFAKRYEELQKEFKDKEFKEKEKELLKVEIELQPGITYDIVKKVPLSLQDEIFLFAHISDLPEELK
jgi:hypothetical protein